MNKQTHFVNYQHYDDKLRRVAVFGDFDEQKQELRVIIITCSKDDNFSKSIAHTKYLGYIGGYKFINIHPVVKTFNFDFTNPNYSPVKVFKSFLKMNYWRKSQMIIGARYGINGLKIIDTTTVDVYIREGKKTKFRNLRVK